MDFTYPKNKDLFYGAGFLTLSIYQGLPNFISNMKTQFRKNILYAYNMDPVHTSEFSYGSEQ